MRPCKGCNYHPDVKSCQLVQGNVANLEKHSLSIEAANDWSGIKLLKKK
jgi:hypothetical protein